MISDSIYGPLPVNSLSSSDSENDRDSQSHSDSDTDLSISVAQQFYGARQSPLLRTAARGSIQSLSIHMPRVAVNEVSTEQAMLPCTHTGKVVMLGSSGVGKTQFLLGATEGKRTDVLNSVADLGPATTTLGGDFRVVTRLMRERDLLKIMVWDTAGQERYQALMPNYIKAADGVILLYDITNPSSFADLERLWMPLIDSNRECNDQLIVFLVGNKVDRVAQRATQAADVADFIARHRLQSYFEATALKRSSIYEVVDAMAASIYHTRAAHTNTQSNGVLQLRKPHEQAKNCCKK